MSIDLNVKKTTNKRYTSGGLFEYILILCNKDAREEYWFDTNSHKRNVKEKNGKRFRLKPGLVMMCIPQYIRFHTVDASVLVLFFVVSHEIAFFY